MSDAAEMPLEEKRQRDIIGGLTLFGEAGHWGVDAQHDVIYAGPDPEDAEALSPAQRKAVEDLNWHPSGEGDCWEYFT